MGLDYPEALSKLLTWQVELGELNIEISWNIPYILYMDHSSEATGITAWISKLQFDLCYPTHLIPTCIGLHCNSCLIHTPTSLKFEADK